MGYAMARADAISTPPPSAKAHRGVVLTATGVYYRRLARVAAETVKLRHPDLPICLFADEPVDDPVYDMVQILETPWRRSKIDAMIDSPFEQTLYLDADVIVAGEIIDLFDLLDRFDLALAHDSQRNTPHATAVWRKPLSAAFPQFNSGVIVYRRDPRVLALFAEWRRVVFEGDQTRDQPALRELLYDSDLRIATLPEDYNFSDVARLVLLDRSQLPPRILHCFNGVALAAPSSGRGALDEALGPAFAVALRAMADGDLVAAANHGRSPKPLGRLAKRFLQIRMIAAWFWTRRSRRR